MRRRGAALLCQAASGLLGRPAAPAASAAAAGVRRLAPLAAAHPTDSNGASFSSNGSSGSSKPPAGSSSGELDAAIAAAVPEGWSPRQRAALHDAVQAKMADLQEQLGSDVMGLWKLKHRPQLLATLGISGEELSSAVLSKYGTGAEAHRALAALVASKQAAVMEGGAEHWAHLQEQRRLGPLQGGPPAAAAPPPQQAGQQQQQPALQQQLAPPPLGRQQAGRSDYVPSWRQQQQEQGAAAAARYQQQAGPPMEPTPPASSQVAPGERRAQWQQQSAQGPPPGPQQQQRQGPPPPRVSIRDRLNEQGIRLPAYAAGTYNHQMCPWCQGGDKGEKSLSVTIDEGSENAVWNCFRAKCGMTGSTNVKPNATKAYRQFTNTEGFPVTAMRKRKEEPPPQRPNPNFDAELSPPVEDFFAERGISATTLERNRVAQERVASEGGSIAIAFPYYRDGHLVNIKYRGLEEKKFWQVKGAEKVLYGLDDIAGCSEIIIVEGEMDKLSLEEAGFRNVVSVPDGAPARVKDGEVPPADQDTKFSYLWNCRAWLDQASKVVIATDNDAPGDALAEELARRLGRERCWRVRWPLNQEDHAYAAEMAGVAHLRQDGSSNGNGAAEGAGAEADVLLDGLEPDLPDGSEASSGEDAEAAALTAAVGGPEALQLLVQPAWYRKDANEVLMKDGAPMLRAFLENAEPFPIRGLLRFHEYYDDIIKYYRLEHKDGQGRSTGWPTLDQYYKVIPGELTIVTGVPNSGKSEWIDALLANLSEMHDWTFALCSMEKKATDHARQLVEKYVGKPFFDLPYARGVRRMSERELDEGLDWIDDRFHLVRYEDDALPAVDWVLDVARAAVYRYGIRGLVIDPYNELDHQRPASMNETEYVSQMLTKVKRFAQTTGVHVWFVAHPRQLREWKGQPPNLYDISGSAHFINKADNGIVVHRDRDPDSPDQHKVQILVRKVRNKAAGTIGDCVLEYERVNGRYIDPDFPSGGCRTAERIDFAAMARQQARAEEAATAAFEASSAPPPAASAAAPPAPAAASAAPAPGPFAAAAAGVSAAAAAVAAAASRVVAPPPPAGAQSPAGAGAAERAPAGVAAAVGGAAQFHTQAQPAQQQQQQPVRAPQVQVQPRPSPPPPPPVVPIEEEEPPPPPPPPSVRWGRDGTINGDPLTDEEEVKAWLQGTDW